MEDLCDGKGGFKGDHAVAARLAAVEPAVEIVVKTRAESRAERIVWAEAMNIPSIGAHLEVATCERCQTPGAVPLMWAAEGRRQALVTWLEAKSRNDLDAAEPGLSWSAPAESYDLVWPGGLYHVDDEVRKSAGETVLRIARVNEPLPVLRPA